MYDRRYTNALSLKTLVCLQSIIRWTAANVCCMQTDAIFSGPAQQLLSDQHSSASVTCLPTTQQESPRPPPLQYSDSRRSMKPWRPNTESSLQRHIMCLRANMIIKMKKKRGTYRNDATHYVLMTGALVQCQPVNWSIHITNVSRFQL